MALLLAVLPGLCSAWDPARLPSIPDPVPSAQKSGYSQAKQDLHSRGPVRAHAAQGCASLWLPFARLVLPGCRLVSLGQLCVCALCGTVYHTAEKVGVAWKEHYFWKGSQTITKL